MHNFQEPGQVTKSFKKCAGRPSMIKEADVEYISAVWEVKEWGASLISTIWREQLEMRESCASSYIMPKKRIFGVHRIMQMAM